MNTEPREKPQNETGYTPEPWVIADFSNEAVNVFSLTGDTTVACDCFPKDAERIIACVNTCAGIKNLAAIPQLIEAATRFVQAWHGGREWETDYLARLDNALDALGSGDCAGETESGHTATQNPNDNPRPRNLS